MIEEEKLGRTAAVPPPAPPLITGPRTAAEFEAAKDDRQQVIGCERM
jgi:hypothetical protein